MHRKKIFVLAALFSTFFALNLSGANMDRKRTGKEIWGENLIISFGIIKNRMPLLPETMHATIAEINQFKSTLNHDERQLLDNLMLKKIKKDAIAVHKNDRAQFEQDALKAYSGKKRIKKYRPTLQPSRTQ